MIKPNKTNFGRVIMDVAVYLRGRTPIATAILENGLGNTLHILELQDGECVLFNHDKAHPKITLKNGEILKSGSSSFQGWKSQYASLKTLVVDSEQSGYRQIKLKRTSNLPLLQLPMNLVEKAA